MSNTCLVVLTARGPARLLAEGGTQAWRLKPEKVLSHDYCVCVQNRNNGHWGAADQEHHHAFLVGRIRDVVPSLETPGRYLVRFSEYARIDYPDAWPGLRNPIHYGQLQEFGIDDPATLEWHPMPPPAGGAAAVLGELEDEGSPTPLTIAEAKIGLSLGLGVPEAAIEIIVRA